MRSKQQLQQIWTLHINKWPQEYQTRFWPTFGCKVGQKVLIAMKLELGLWCHLLDVFSKFRINISNISKKARKTEKNSKTRKNNPQNSENKIYEKTGTYAKQYAKGYLRIKFQGFILIYESMIAKKWVWPTFGCKLRQSDPIMIESILNMPYHLLNVYTKFEIDISKHVEKSPENSDGWTDGRTDRRTDIATA